MPSRSRHAQRGAIVGYEEYVAYKRRRGEEPNLIEALFWAGVGSFAANVADDLEPPTGPSHRSYLHSHEALLLANQQYDARDDLLSKVFLRAFASHLVDDSRTTAGLPLATVKLIRALDENSRFSRGILSAIPGWNRLVSAQRNPCRDGYGLRQNNRRTAGLHGLHGTAIKY